MARGGPAELAAEGRLREKKVVANAGRRARPGMCGYGRGVAAERIGRSTGATVRSSPVERCCFDVMRPLT